MNAPIPNPEHYKQVLLVRADLNMRRGKEIAQGAHASLKAVLENIDHPDVQTWLSGPFTKVALSVQGEAELVGLYEKARAAGMVCALIEDAGRTEFGGVKTLTVAAIGPARVDEVNAITGHLKLR